MRKNSNDVIDAIGIITIALIAIAVLIAAIAYDLNFGYIL